MIIKIDKKISLSSIPLILEHILKDKGGEKYSKITIYTNIYKNGKIERTEELIEYGLIEHEETQEGD